MAVALRRLDRVTLEKAMEGLLDGPQIDGLLARRDTIVRCYEDAIARRGEAAVLYDLPSRATAAPQPRRSEALSPLRNQFTWPAAPRRSCCPR